MESDTVSQLRKKPHTQGQATHPVLLTLKYDIEQIKRLIQLGIDAGIRICTRVDIVTPNGLSVSEDFSLSPEQIKNVWQIRPKIIPLYLKPPENLTEHLSEVIVADVGIEGLLIDKISADYYLSITQEKPNSEYVDQVKSPKKKLNFREDAISFALLKHILPQLLPNKSGKLTNIMQWDCFLQLEESLKKDGGTNIITIREGNKEQSTISGIDCDKEEIYTTYKALKERLKNLVPYYQTS